MSVEIDIVILVGIILIAMAASVFAGMVIGYTYGVRDAEKRFLDKFLNDKKTAG
jgi:nitrogen fixation protein FixH